MTVQGGAAVTMYPPRILTGPLWLAIAARTKAMPADCHLRTNRSIVAGGVDEDGGESGEEGGTRWPDALVDVLLAQLARPAQALPSAALRDAVEAVFRAVCHDITPTGMLLLLRPPPHLRRRPQTVQWAGPPGALRCGSRRFHEQGAGCGPPRLQGRFTAGCHGRPAGVQGCRI